jgi:hypothetical protein
MFHPLASMFECSSSKFDARRWDALDLRLLNTARKRTLSASSATLCRPSREARNKRTMDNSYESSIVIPLSTERYTVANRHKNSKESLKLITRRSKSLGEH